MFALTPWKGERATRALRPRFEPFRLMHEEFAPLFERLFGTWPVEAWEWPRGLTLTEAENEIVVRAELPGFEPPEVEVVLRGNELTVEAKHVEVAEGKEAPAEERPFAHVRRTMMLPEGLELAKAEAVYRNGVLEVHVPRLPEAVGRRIEVKV
jgi:HSP20 family protein